MYSCRFLQALRWLFDKSREIYLLDKSSKYRVSIYIRMYVLKYWILKERLHKMIFSDEIVRLLDEMNSNSFL